MHRTFSMSPFSLDISNARLDLSSALDATTINLERSTMRVNTLSSKVRVSWIDGKPTDTPKDVIWKGVELELLQVLQSQGTGRCGITDCIGHRPFNCSEW